MRIALVALILLTSGATWRDRAGAPPGAEGVAVVATRNACAGWGALRATLAASLLARPAWAEADMELQPPPAQDYERSQPEYSDDPQAGYERSQPEYNDAPPADYEDSRPEYDDAPPADYEGSQPEYDDAPPADSEP